MHHDQRLLDVLSGLRQRPFTGEVFRATRGSLDALEPSSSGGRWAPQSEPEAAFPVLYTSLERDAAVAEVASYMSEMRPVPHEQNLKVSRIVVSARSSVTLLREDFGRLGIDPARYGERDYARTQAIGAGLTLLGVDGLLAPSARWPCQNLMIFTDNHSLGERLEVLGTEDVAWRAWAQQSGVLE